MNVILWYLCFF